MSKKISINIGRIVIGVPSKPPRPEMGPGAKKILHQILTGKFDGDDDENKIASMEEIQESLTKYVGTLEEDLADMAKEEHPDKAITFVDGFGDVGLAKAQEVLSARVADLKPILELVDKAIANEEARQQAHEASE